MRVYFSGSHGSGKTTLARYVSQQYNLPMLPEVARAVLAEKELQLDALRVNLDIVDDYQTEVFHRQIKEEQKFEAFVSDRSILDCLGYSAQHSRVFHSLMKDSALEPYIEKLRAKDTYIFFVRPSKVTMKEDGVRESLSWDGVIAIDAQIKLLHQLYNLDYYQIDMSSMQERVQFLTSVLKNR